MFSGLLHIGICYLFVHTLEFGQPGAAIALNINYLLNLTSFVIFCLYSSQTKETIARWGRESFREFGEILKYGLPSAASLFLDWSAFEVLSIFIG